MSKEILERALEKLHNKLESPSPEYTNEHTYEAIMFEQGIRKGRQEVLALFKLLIERGDL